MNVLVILGTAIGILVCVAVIGYLAACAGANKRLSLRQWLSGRLKGDDG